MTTKKILIALLPLALAAALVVIGGRAGAQNPPGGGIAVVNINQVLDGYTAYAQANRDFQQWLVKRQADFQLRTALALLDKDELQNYYDLKNQAAKTDAQLARMAELAGVSEQRSTELEKLDGKPPADLTDMEKARLATLRGIWEWQSKALQAEESKMTAEIDAEHKKRSQPFNAKVDDALAAVAKANGVDLILSKEIRVPLEQSGQVQISPVVLYGAKDLTDKVLERLNAA
jgi:Skp family chaperone for outer membrane proteins